MKDKVMMSSGINVLSDKFYAGVLLIVILRINSLMDGQRMANGFLAGMNAIRNRYLSEMFVSSGSAVTVEKIGNGNNNHLTVSS